MTIAYEAQSASAALRDALARGERDVNRLSNSVFFARHPERHGRSIRKGERAAAREWIAIRDTIVLPALRQPVVTPPPVMAASRFVLPPDPAQMRPAARTHIRAVPLVTGERAIETMANLIATVASRPDGWVYMANWYANVNMTLASGRTFGRVLADCYARGGTIRALLWEGSLEQTDPILHAILSPVTMTDSSGSLSASSRALIERQLRDMLASKFTNKDVNTATAAFINKLGPRARAELDDATLTFGSHHQKILVVGNNERIDAVMGGVDWHQNRVRAVRGDNGTPLFDIAVQLDGQAAVDLAELFEERWRADSTRAAITLPPRVAPPASPAPSGATVQIAPNFGCGKPFKRRAIRGARTRIPARAIRGANTLIAHTLSNCRRFFYAEDQYGIGNAELEGAIWKAFANGAKYGIVVLANTAAVGDIPEIAFRRHQFWSRFPQIDRNLLVFDRFGDAGHPFGSHAYVHSKFVLVDDEAATIGSVNMSRRSWYHDSELACLITDAPDLIRGLRMDVWSQHLSLRAGEDIRDPAGGLAVWRSRWDDKPPTSRLRRISFRGAAPRRKSDELPKVVRYLPTVKRTVNDVMDIAFDRLFDPAGPPSC
jgi:hypothetical protein